MAMPSRKHKAFKLKPKKPMKCNPLLHFKGDLEPILKFATKIANAKGYNLTEEQVADMVYSQYYVAANSIKVGDGINNRTMNHGCALIGIGSIKLNTFKLLKNTFGKIAYMYKTVKSEAKVLEIHLKLANWHLYRWDSIDGFIYVNSVERRVFKLGLHRAYNIFQAHKFMYYKLCDEGKLQPDEFIENLILD